MRLEQVGFCPAQTQHELPLLQPPPQPVQLLSSGGVHVPLQQ